jgi:hypothetical protein
MKRTKILDCKILPKTGNKTINGLRRGTEDNNIININQQINTNIWPLKNK